MPGWASSSWGYHGDDGKRFNHPQGVGLRYYDSYSTGDTVGCGINMKTGKMFFTKNGVNLGKDFFLNLIILLLPNNERGGGLVFGKR